jgi:hypothetical protein
MRRKAIAIFASKALAHYKAFTVLRQIEDDIAA